ncbi:MAG: hypothetical protein ACRDZ7_06800 [Acidimicrobiia bacterium]
MTRRMVMAVALPVVALGAIAIGSMAGSRSVDRPKKDATSSTTASPASGNASALVEFQDEAHGFALSYPKDWMKLESSDPEVVLVVSDRDPSEGRGGSILARVVDTGVAIGADQLAEAKRFTDQVVTADQGVELKAEPTEINQGGLPGWLYFYTFTDPARGTKGAHTHYFLFKNTLMISLVFQGLPEDEFIRLAEAKVFDQVANSFRLL